MWKKQLEAIVNHFKTYSGYHGNQKSEKSLFYNKIY